MYLTERQVDELLTTIERLVKGSRAESLPMAHVLVHMLIKEPETESDMAKSVREAFGTHGAPFTFLATDPEEVLRRNGCGGIQVFTHRDICDKYPLLAQRPGVADHRTSVFAVGAFH